MRKKISLFISVWTLVIASVSVGYPVQEGVSSYYGKKFHGRRTASGEIFNMYAMTAAHKTMPLGTLVEVTNLENSKKVVVKINDRGPFKKERILDLSYMAAKKLDMIEKGTARVSVRPLSADWIMSSIEPEEQKKLKEEAAKEAEKEKLPVIDSIASVYTIQLGAFKNPESAFEFYQSSQFVIKNVFINGPWGDKKIYKIQTGSFFAHEEAKTYLQLIQRMGYEQAFITPVAGS